MPLLFLIEGVWDGALAAQLQAVSLTDEVPLRDVCAESNSAGRDGIGRMRCWGVGAKLARLCWSRLGQRRSLDAFHELQYAARV